MNATTRDHESRDYLVFRVGDVCCGVDVGVVQEINRNMDITRVFLAPEHVRGVINLRGRIVTVVDLARRLGVETALPPESPKNVVVSSRGELVGLLVDDVDDIVQAGDGLLRPPPHLPERFGACALGVLPSEDRLVVVLDVDEVAR